MNLKLIVLYLIILTPNLELWCQNRIDIIIPTVKQETEYVWRNIQDIEFFEKHNYDLVLPQAELIDSLKAKSRSNRLTQNDFDALESLMETQIYNQEDYQKAFEKIETQRDLINKMVNQLNKCKREWNFKNFDKYKINLTLYGPGGSHNPNDGSIIIFATKEGKFKQYDNPANTLIHEIVHIGIEESIINEFDVIHSLKERIVDKFVWLNFVKELPEYRIQNMGDERIDNYLSKKKDLKTLNKIVEEFLQKYGN